MTRYRSFCFHLPVPPSFYLTYETRHLFFDNLVVLVSISGNHYMYFDLFVYAWCPQFYNQRTKVVYDVMVSACEDMSKGAVAPIYTSLSTC